MWVLPTRGRPANLRRFFWFYNQMGGAVGGSVLTDHDDCPLPMPEGLPDNWHMIGQPRAGLAERHNHALGLFPNEPWYGLAADDLVPLTPGFEQRLIEAAGSDRIAFGPDGINDDRLVGHCVIGGDLVREIGWLMLPGLARLYADNVWTDIGHERGCLRYLPDVRLAHLHFSTGQSAFDETYRKPEADSDKRIYDAWTAGRLSSAA